MIELNDYLDPFVYFETDCDEYYHQSLGRAMCENVTFKEAWTKIRTFIADILDWIVKWVKNIVSWVKKLFSNKKPKSVEQILTDLGIVSESDISSGKVVIPKSNDSTVTPMQPSDIGFALKPLMVSFQNDQSIRITFKHVVNSMTDNSYDGKIKGQNSGLSGVPKILHGLYKLGYGRPIVALYFIKNMDRSQDSLLAYCEGLDKQMANKGALYKASDSIDHFWIGAKEFADHNKDGCDVQISELEQFGKTLAKCSEHLKKYDDGNNSVDRDYFTAANKVSNMLAELQYGLNDITKSLRGVYVIDPSYCNTIRDVGVLSKFSEVMINSGIPSKYIGFNVYMASHGDIKGEGSPLEPVWGQSRVTLFPTNRTDIVYKVALNGTGIRSNRLEATTWASVQSTQYAVWFAGVTQITQNRCVLEMERVDTDKKGPIHKGVIVSDVRQQINEICDKLKLPNDLSTDIHPGNIGWKNGHVCIIDYGNSVSNLNAFNRT